MKLNYKLENEILNTEFEYDDYIALILSFANDNSKGHKYLEISHADKDVVGFSFSANTCELSKFKFVSCKDFIIEKSNLTLPNFEIGKIFIDSEKTGYETSILNTDFFSIQVFTNGLKILFSKKSPVKSIKNGNLIFSMDSENCILALYLVNLSEKEINHTIEVLVSSKC